MTQQDATVNIHVNNQEAEQKVNELSDRARQLRKEFAEAVRIGDRGTIAKTEKELRKVNKELNNATLRAARIRDAMKHLSEATPKELHNTLKLINQELNSGAVKRGSKEWKQYQEQIKQVNAELKKIQAESREVNGSFKGKIANVANLAVAITSGMQIYEEVIGKLRGLVSAYADHDAAMANTQKFTGMTREEVERLNEEFKKMDTRTSLEGLNELAQAAGRLGKNSVDDVMGFVRAGDIIGVAMDELGAEAPEIISKLAGIFNLESELGTEKAMLSVGSAINSLSQNCAAGAPNLVEFASRMGAVATQSHMTMDEMLAFGAVLDSNNVTMEKGSTAMQGVITKMYANPAKFAKAAGIDIAQFTEALKRSSTEGIMLFVDALSKMDQMQMSAVLSSLGTAGAGVVQTFQTLAGKTDELKTRLSESKQAFDEATSATEEYNIQNNTVQAQLDKAKEKFNQMAAELGEKLYPAMKYAISGTSLLMKAMKVLIEFISNHKGALLTLTAAYIAYKIAVNKAIIVEKAEMVITKASTALKYAWTTALKLSAAAVALCTGNVQKATIAWRAFSMALKANPMGLLVGAITAVVGGLISWIATSDDAVDKAEELKQKNKELLDSYTDIASKTAEYAKQEINQLEQLYKAATDEAKSKDERIAAANRIKKMYPEYFSKMNTETILVGKAKGQYDALTKSIIKTAEARAAAAKIEENTKKIIELKSQRNQVQEQHKNDYSDMDEKGKAYASVAKSHQDQDDLYQQAYAHMYPDARAAANAYNSAKSKWEASGKKLDEIDIEINVLLKSNDYLRKTYGDVPLSTPADPSINFTGADSDGKGSKGGKGSGGSSSSTDNKKFKDVENWRTQELKKNQDDYKQGLISLEVYRNNALKIETDYYDKLRTHTKASDEEKLKFEEEYNKALAKKREDDAGILIRKETETLVKKNKAAQRLNLVEYSTGKKSYLEYTQEKYNITLKTLENQKKALVKAGLKDTELYKSILAKEEELRQEQSSVIRDLTLDDIEIRRKKEEDALTSQYLNPSSPMYQNQKAYRQELLNMDIKYLQQKQKLYDINTKEWADIQNEIDQRIREDQLQKQQETAEAYARFQEEYGKASGSVREKMELANLDNLLEQKLITEEEYQKARRKIIEKYQDEDREKERTVQSEYADMVVNLYDSFKKFFDELGKDGTNFWENLSNASQAAFAVMGAALSQYSAYADAERDLELAQVEHRYDAEIEKVGKNNKKKEQLEKQKEAKIAAIKKEYNERAMKIEMANAVAQTALAAISAYASGSQVNVFLGPIASALALAAGAVQIATIKKQHQAEAIGYYEGGYTGKALDNHKEVGVVHANEFVANHKAVANPRLRPLFNLLDSAQRNNTVGSLTANDVSNALGQGRGVTARAEVTNTANEQVGTGLALVAGVMTSAGNAIDRLNKRIDDGIETVMIMDGERGFAKKYEHYKKLSNSPKR